MRQDKGPLLKMEWILLRKFKGRLGTGTKGLNLMTAPVPTDR